MVIDGSEYDLDHFDVALVRPWMSVEINIASINIPDGTTIESVDATNNTIVLSDDLTWFVGQVFTANTYREIENVNAQVVIRDEIEEDDDIEVRLEDTPDSLEDGVDWSTNGGFE